MAVTIPLVAFDGSGDTPTPTMRRTIPWKPLTDPTIPLEDFDGSDDTPTPTMHHNDTPATSDERYPEINTIKNPWKLKLHILSMWRSTYTIDMIVMDEKSGKIHVVLKNDLMPAFESSLVEGNVLFLSNFGVAANKGRYTVLNNKYKLNFYRAIEVRRVSAFDGPTHGFSFVPFRDVFNYIGDPNLPVDIIGSVVDCGNMEVYNKKEDKKGKRITLDLQDLEYSLYPIIYAL